MNTKMRIGELTERAGVTTRTVRYYESLGLLGQSEREGKGFHYYTEETLARLQKIDFLKQLGLSLEEISSVIDLYFTDPTGIEGKRQVLVILRRHLAEAQEKIADLQLFCTELQTTITRIQALVDQAEPS